MTYYFIDFENVHEMGLKGVEALPAEDRVHLFYTVNANKLSWELFETCRSSNIILHKVAAGKQALDMMLSSFLGHTVALDPTARFVIISRDRDYDPVVDFWNLADPPVAVSRSISIAVACGGPVEQEEPESVEEQPERRRTFGRYGNRSGGSWGRGRAGVHRFGYDSAPRVAVPVAEKPHSVGTPAEPVAEATAKANAVTENAPAAELKNAVREQEGEAPALSERQDAGQPENPTPAESDAAAGTESAPKQENTERRGRTRRNSRSRTPRAQRSAESAAEETENPATAEAKPEEPAGQDETASPEQTETARTGAEKPRRTGRTQRKPADPEKKPQENARRNGAESNAVHNAIQKVLAKEKVESATIATLASLTAKNWGKPNDKQLIYRAVIKQFGQKEGLRLYGIMKPCLVP